MRELLAHTPQNGRSHLLVDHLKAVADGAGASAAAFGCGDLGYWLGALDGMQLKGVTSMRDGEES